jgi:hypothetical protein
VDRAFLKVLIQAASQAEAVQLGNPPFDAGLAAAADTLSQKGYTANRLLIPQGYLFRLRQMGVVVADNQVRSKHYAGSALGGLLVFCSVDLPPDEIFLFDSRLYAALMGKRDFERLDQGRRPFTREVVGRVRFNAIVKDTRAVVKLVGLETALVACLLELLAAQAHPERWTLKCSSIQTGWRNSAKSHAPSTTSRS